MSGERRLLRVAAVCVKVESASLDGISLLGKALAQRGTARATVELRPLMTAALGETIPERASAGGADFVLPQGEAPFIVGRVYQLEVWDRDEPLPVLVDPVYRRTEKEGEARTRERTLEVD